MSLKSDIQSITEFINRNSSNNREIKESLNRIVLAIPAEKITPPCNHTWLYHSLYTYGSEVAGARTCSKCDKYEEGLFLCSLVKLYLLKITA